VVPPEGNAISGRGKFTDEGCAPANQPEPPSSWPANQLDRGKQKDRKEDEDVGAEDDGLIEKSNLVHQF
jgi:hypothetical protein